MLDGLADCYVCIICWRDYEPAVLAIDAGRIGSLLCLQYMLEGYEPAVLAILQDGLTACYACSICWMD